MECAAWHHTEVMGMAATGNIIWCREVLDTAKEIERRDKVSPVVVLEHAIWTLSSKHPKPSEKTDAEIADQGRRAVA